jgi:Uma2 family endonuclease
MKGRATADDLERWRGEYNAEVIDGVVVAKAGPRGEHGNAQLALGAFLRSGFDAPAGGGRRPGGWWILGEVDVELETHQVFCPDLVGWRRDRLAERPRGRPITARPDWVCEILSPSTARNDLVEKLRVYQRRGVEHYWIVDPAAETLTVYRHRDGDYLVALTAGRGERALAEPFAALPLPVGLLFGDEPDD